MRTKISPRQSTCHASFSCSSRTLTLFRAYKPFVDHFAKIADFSKAELYHARLTPHPPEAALADHVSPCTEILRVFFPTNYSDSDQKKTEEDIKKLVKAIEDNSDKYTGSAGGWVEEDVSIPDSEEKGKVYLVLIGWKSMEDHMAFRDTQAFKDNIHYLRGAKDLKKFHVVHYSGTMVQPGAGGVGDESGYTAQEEVLNPQDPGPGAPKTRADGTTTKNNDDLKGASNSLKKERQGR